MLPTRHSDFPGLWLGGCPAPD